MLVDLLAMWRQKREKKKWAKLHGAQASAERAQADIERSHVERVRLWAEHERLRANGDRLLAMGDGGTGRPGTEGSGSTSVVAMAVGEKRRYNNGEAEFMLEPLSDSVVRVTHRDQVSYFGFNRKWEPSEPYTWAAYEGYVYADGIDGSPSLTYRTPDGALRALCPLILKAQRREDARRINPKERKRAARQVLAEFMNELAD